MVDEKILIFETRPGDAALHTGGSAVKWLSQGKELMLCTITAGSISSFDMAASQQEIAQTAEAEHSEAMRIFGLDDGHAVQWDYDCLNLISGADRQKLLEDAVMLIRTFQPATVVAMDPGNRHDAETPGHSTAAAAVFEAASLAAYPNVFREQFESPGTEQHFVSRLLFYMSHEPNVFINIEGSPLEMKIRLGSAYKSQTEQLLREGRQRLRGLGLEAEIFKLPGDAVWPQMCKVAAAEAADECRRINPQRMEIQFAESFRLQYPGIVHKIKDLLPPDPGLT